jgi:hypothetical protein
MRCEMLKSPPTVLIAYIAVKDSPLLVSHCSHFVDSYRCHPPGFDHHLLIVCNGGHLSEKNKAIFAAVPHEFLVRTNDAGWDISAYIDVARRFDSDLQVCLGESVYFHRKGWLARLVECYKAHGRGMYGFFSSYLVRPHLNTTAFAVSPQYLREYPVPSDRATRYEFEHGARALWRRIAEKNGATRLTTWDGCYSPEEWRKAPNILWRGTQDNLLMRCNHTDRWEAASEPVRRAWTHGADSNLITR